VERIDFLSMDIELAEPKALAGFDIKRFRPALICIEAHPPILEELQTYFAANDYVELAEYSAIDPLNRYFTPRERR
jgi:hypothetical protein